MDAAQWKIFKPCKCSLESFLYRTAGSGLYLPAYNVCVDAFARKIPQKKYFFVAKSQVEARYTMSRTG
jgi:hypothetical protein